MTLEVAVDQSPKETDLQRASDPIPSTLPPHLASEIHCAARSDAAVLITANETLASAVARFVHSHGVRQHAPFVVVDCREAERVLSGQLTAALESKDAPGSTVFLEHIDKLPQQLQALVADGFAHGIGNGEVDTWPRVISSTESDLLDRVKHGTFDESLFYRLNTVHILVPTA